jgi:hypothetical protein
MSRLSELSAHKKEIAKEVILVVITCGFYDIFWQYQQIQFVNLALGQEKYSFVRWLVFTMLTCGLYNFYHEYKMSQDFVALQLKAGLTKSDNLPMLSILLCVFGLPIVVEAIQQLEINKLVDVYNEKGI